MKLIKLAFLYSLPGVSHHLLPASRNLAPLQDALNSGSSVQVSKNNIYIYSMEYQDVPFLGVHIDLYFS